MAKVSFKRIQNSADIDNVPMLDGQLIYTKDGKTYMDYEGERIATGQERVETKNEYSTSTIDAYSCNYVNETIKNTYSEDNKSAYSCNYVNSSFEIKGTILWVNTNPNNPIQNALNITLNESDSNFDALEVYFKISNDGTDVDTAKGLVGYSINMSASGYQGAGLRRRISRNSSTSYTIGTYNGEPLSDSGTGKYIIPIYIVGYKTGLFY